LCIGLGGLLRQHTGRAVSFSNFSTAKIMNENINIRLERQKFNSQFS